MSSGESLTQVLSLCAAPALTMLVGGLAATKLTFGQNFMAAMQHLGGGVVVAAVALEIVPKLTEATSSHTITLAIVVGYSTGVAAMLALKALSGEDDDEPHTTAQPLLAAGSSRRGSMARLSSRKSVVGIATSRAEAGEAEVPWHLFVAVGTDSFMDGLLVGIALIAGEKAGLVLALAMAIEMGFLGTVFSVSLQGCAPAVRVGGCVLMPALIIVGGVVGCLGAHALATHEALFVFVLAFGAAALLYLVTEELLLEHHEKGGEHVWYIDLMFFVGFMLVLVLERAT